MNSILSTKNLSKTFRARGQRIVALNDLNLDVEEGEFVTIVGPSGCGKSTLLNLIVGLEHPSRGEVIYRGQKREGFNTQIGYVTQNDNLMPWRTLKENVGFALELRGGNGAENRTRVHEFIRRVGLGGFENHYPHELSGGMRQRANIIRTLIYDPAVILMDEPFGPLDAQTRVILQAQLLKLWETSRKTVLFITHDLVEAIALADRVVMMTGRPGTIKSITHITIPRPRDVFHIHRSPVFQETFDTLWEELRAEVEQRNEWA